MTWRRFRLFEEVTLKGPQAANEKNIAVKRLSLAFLVALNKMHEEAATNSLLRHAVMSSFGDVRSAAIADLRYRPLEDFVPTLLDNFVAPDANGVSRGKRFGR